MKIKLDQLTSNEVSQLFVDKIKKMGLILPVGCIEQHGPYLPLGCDMAIARKVSEVLALNLKKNALYQAFVMPDCPYTPSPGAEHTMGTISVSFDLLGKNLFEIIKAAIRTPWDFIAIINAHAHNHGRVIETSIMGSSGCLGRTIPIVVINIYDFLNIAEDTGLNGGSHGGEMEIALYHHYFQDFQFKEAKIENKISKERPSRIYGLEIMPRSYNGIISNGIPNLSRALEKSKEVGQKINDAILTMLIANLDNYFKCWCESNVEK